MENTKESAKQWIESGRPCVYRYGFGWKGASTKLITNEEATALLPTYSFGMGFYELKFTKIEGVDVLLFNEFSENDMM